MGERENEQSLITEDVAAYLDEMRIPLRLAVLTQSGWPVVLSLWYVLIDGVLWCATQDTARVVRYLRREPRCGFEVASEQPPYRGVRGQGRATVSPERGEEILGILLDRYLGGKGSSLARRLLARADREVAIGVTPTRVHTWDYTERMRD